MLWRPQRKNTKDETNQSVIRSVVNISNYKKLPTNIIARLIMDISKISRKLIAMVIDALLASLALGFWCENHVALAGDVNNSLIKDSTMLV